MKFLIITVSLMVLCGSFGANSERGNYENEVDLDDEENKTPLGRCVSGKECNVKSECSVMGMQRFSEPECKPLSGLGEPCRMGASPDNKTLNFPHITLECEDVYMQFCPCAANLVCHEATCQPLASVGSSSSSKQPKRPRSSPFQWTSRAKFH